MEAGVVRGGGRCHGEDVVRVERRVAIEDDRKIRCSGKIDKVERE